MPGVLCGLWKFFTFLGEEVAVQNIFPSLLL